MTVSTQGRRTQGSALPTPYHALRPPVPHRPARRRPGPRPLRRLATLASAIAAALVGVLLVATPAHAEGEVRVTIDGLSDTLQAGGIDDFRVTFTNESRESISGVVAMIAVALPGAPPDAVVVQRTGESGLSYQVTGEGTVIFTDSTPFDLGRGGGNARRRVDFTIFFRDHVPTGECVVTVGAYARGELLGSASVAIEVRGAATTPPNTDPGVVPTFEAGPSYSIAPLPETAAAAPPNTTMPTTVYVAAALLMLTGLITLILTFWAPGRQFAEGYAPARGGHREPDGRRPMVWPTRAPAAAPRPPRPAYPSEPERGGPLAETARPWPAVTRSGPPTAYPRPAGAAPVRDSGPATRYGRAVSDSGPSTGTGRAIRDPRGGGRPARDADDRWRYD
jgi:hypothetical protein